MDALCSVLKLCVLCFTLSAPESGTSLEVLACTTWQGSGRPPFTATYLCNWQPLIGQSFPIHLLVSVYIANIYADKMHNDVSNIVYLPLKNGVS